MNTHASILQWPTLQNPEWYHFTIILWIFLPTASHSARHRDDAKWMNVLYIYMYLHNLYKQKLWSTTMRLWTFRSYSSIQSLRFNANFCQSIFFTLLRCVPSLASPGIQQTNKKEEKKNNRKPRLHRPIGVYFRTTKAQCESWRWKVKERHREEGRQECGRAASRRGHLQNQNWKMEKFTHIFKDTSATI